MVLIGNALSPDFLIRESWMPWLHGLNLAHGMGLRTPDPVHLDLPSKVGGKDSVSLK